MGLQDLQAEWSRLAETDPLWAISAVPGTRGNRWDVAEFFRVGERRVESVLAHIRGLPMELATDDVLDFGCGVGRATQPFARHFKRCVGVDIAPPMIETARRLNRFGNQCEYLLNSRPDLSMFRDASFDLVYSHAVLQHNPRRIALGYIREFLRVVRPGGISVFHMLSGPTSRWLRWIPYRILDPALNRARTVARRVVHPGEPAWQSHWIPPAAVGAFVRKNMGEVSSTMTESPLKETRTGQTMDQHTYFVRPRPG